MTAQQLACGEQMLNLTGVPTVPFGVGELGAVIGQYGMDLVGNRFNQGPQKDTGNPSGGFFKEFDKGEF